MRTIIDAFTAMRVKIPGVLAVAASIVGAGETRPDAAGQPLVVDFRYAPPWWQTCIGLPDDWQKTLVGRDGELLYDYPGNIGGFAAIPGFRIRIACGVASATGWVSQELVDPRVPIVRTLHRSGDVEVIQEAFAATDLPAPAASGPPATLVIERLDTEDSRLEFASPARPCDPAFRSAATHWSGSIRYAFRAASGASYTIALGLCEGHHSEPGQRILDLRIEGRTRKTVDTVRDIGQNVPAVFLVSATDDSGDGWIEIEVGIGPGARDPNAILNALWVFETGANVTQAALVDGRPETVPLAFVDCGGEPPAARRPRCDVILLRLRNKAAAAVRVTPTVTIDSQYPIEADALSQRLAIGKRTVLSASEPFARVERKDGQVVLAWPDTSIGAGQSHDIAVTVARCDPSSPKRTSVEGAIAEREAAERFWRGVNLPYDRMRVPDAGVQGVLDGAIRNIYQAREIKRGMPAFQVGPTCYRGLWVVDGSFLMEAIAYLGQVEEARAGVGYLLGFQRDDGAIMLIDGHQKETGIALWAITRHARLTGDKTWLERVWPNVQRAVRHVESMRRATLANPTAPNAGLIPEGFSDGGLGGPACEYTNVYWTLVGVKAAADAAKWIDRSADAAAWQREYDDFYATFRRAAERDLRTDAYGNHYLPIPMVGAEKVSPQRAQWAFLHAVFPGRLFPPNDPLVTGNMAMLRANEREGLVYGTGWIEHGLWNYFGSFYAHAWLWLDQGPKAAGTLYALANHASPLLAWREEQLPAGETGPEPRFVGDMPHNWASAEFIRLVRHLIVLERGDELHLCEGVPAAWAGPGMTTRLNGILTEFGPISLELKVSEDGKTAKVAIDPPSRAPPRRMVLHLDGWAGRPGTIELPATTGRIEKLLPVGPELTK